MNGVATKAFIGDFQIKNAAAGEVEAIPMTFNVVDRDFDITPPDAVENGADVVMSGYGHDAAYGNPPAGKGSVFVRGDKLVFKGNCFMATQRGRETLEILKQMGSLQPWSIGFRILQSAAPTDEQRKRGARRVLTKIDVFEVSPVVQAAGIGTRTVSAKHATSAGLTFDQMNAEVAAIAQRCLTPPPAPIRPFNIERFEMQYAAQICDTAVVSDAQQKSARFWADRACDVLRDSRVTIIWRVDSMKTAGCFKHSEPNAIFINPTLTVDQIAPTVLHEVAHRHRFLHRMPNDEWLVERDEADLCDLLGVP